MGPGERGSAEQRAAADGAGRQGQRAAEFCGHSSLRVFACRAITVLFVFKIVLNGCFVSFCKVPLLRRSSQQGYMKMIDFNPCTENRFNKYDSAALLSSLDETVVTDCLMGEPKFSLHKVGPLYVLRHASPLAPSPRLLRLGASGCLGRTGKPANPRDPPGTTDSSRSWQRRSRTGSQAKVTGGTILVLRARSVRRASSSRCSPLTCNAGLTFQGTGPRSSRSLPLALLLLLPIARSLLSAPQVRSPR